MKTQASSGPGAGSRWANASIVLLFVMALPVLVSGCYADPSDEANFGRYDEELFLITEQGRSKFLVELADDDDERRVGLMYRKSMPSDAGMLFIFDSDRVVSMWMKDTHISLDMLFIDRDGTIVSFAENTQPFSTRNISSKAPVRAVLELNGGTVEELGVRRGDKVQHRFLNN